MSARVGRDRKGEDHGAGRERERGASVTGARAEQHGLWKARVIRQGGLWSERCGSMIMEEQSRGTISAERRLGKAGVGQSRAEARL